MIICGEPSGDMRAASLVNAIKKLSPGITFSGIGGACCEREGVRLFSNIDDLAVMGFTEVIKNLARIKRVFNTAVAEITKQRPDAVILVDYPGFNLRLAKVLKQKGFKIIYYVSPQVWAWQESRVKLIKKVVDRMMVLFPFEKEFYAKRGYAVDFVGHPIVDEVAANMNTSDFFKKLGLNPSLRTIGLLPGSREKEIINLLPDMLNATKLIKEKAPQTQFILLQAKNVDPSIFNTILASHTTPTITTTSEYYNALNAVDACIVASGTATLETGICGKPMVVVYRTSWLTEMLVRLFIKIRYISLVNIVAGRKLVDELLQKEVTPKNISNEILRFLSNPTVYNKMQHDLLDLRSSLGSSGASQRAAHVVLDALPIKP